VPRHQEHPRYDEVKDCLPHFYCYTGYDGNPVYYERSGQVDLAAVSEDGGDDDDGGGDDDDNHDTIVVVVVVVVVLLLLLLLLLMIMMNMLLLLLLLLMMMMVMVMVMYAFLFTQARRIGIECLVWHYVYTMEYLYKVLHPSETKKTITIFDVNGQHHDNMMVVMMMMMMMMMMLLVVVTMKEVMPESSPTPCLAANDHPLS
jgi:small-conductance mechanosensitive channel